MINATYNGSDIANGVINLIGGVVDGLQQQATSFGSLIVVVVFIGLIGLIIAYVKGIL
jgi:hypothetical protein